MSKDYDRLNGEYYKCVTDWIIKGRPPAGRSSCLRLAIEYRSALKAAIFELSSRPFSSRAERSLRLAEEYLGILEDHFPVVFDIQPSLELVKPEYHEMHDGQVQIGRFE